MSTWKDFRWHLRSRFALGLSLDKVRMVDGHGYDCEVVRPRWWDLRRWWTWLRHTNGHVELVMHTSTGDAIFLNMRTRSIPRPLPLQMIGQRSGKTLVPGPVMKPNTSDPTHRLVSDEYLERHGITHDE